jgi:hypothetical protein
MNDKISDESLHEAESLDEDVSAFNRRFKYALIACAVVEFIAIALVVYYKARR